MITTNILQIICIMVVIRKRMFGRIFCYIAKRKTEWLWCASLSHAEQRELKSLTVIGTGKLVAYSLSCPGSVFFGWVLCSIKICSVRLAVWSVRASRRSQWVPIIFLKIKTVVRAFVSMCIFRDLSQGKYTWKAKLERPWLKGFDLPLIIGTH